MRLLNPDGSEVNVYSDALEAQEKITIWRSPAGLWWAVVQTPAPPDMPEDIKVDFVQAAWAIDKSDRADHQIIKWIERLYERSKHPDLEDTE